MADTCYLLRVSTGCTCCANENFIEGPFLTKEGAKKRAEYHKENRTLSSQYASNGNQEILETTYEIAGEWIILDDKYAVKGKFMDDPEDCEYHERLDMFDRDWRL